MAKEIKPPTPETQFEDETSLIPRLVMQTEMQTRGVWDTTPEADRTWLCRYLSQRLRHQDANIKLYQRRFRENSNFVRDYAYKMAGSIIEEFLSNPKEYKALVRDLEPDSP